MNTLLIFGLGYSGRAVANATPDFHVTATSRSILSRIVTSRRPDRSSPAGIDPDRPDRPGDDVSGACADDARSEDLSRENGGQSNEVTLFPFDDATSAVAAASHILVTAPPGVDGDPVLNRYRSEIKAAPHLQWIGYLSSTVVYGDRSGGWVDEDTPPRPSQPRGQRRLDAELAWSRFAERCFVDIIRPGGIYGPGRSAFNDLRAGTARRMIKPGHQFGRIHRDDIGRAVAAAMRQTHEPGRRVLNLVDDVPAESATVVTEAARVMGISPPPKVAFEDAFPGMSPIARSFWAENRKVSGRNTQQLLGLRWLYPDFREGLAAIWREESGQSAL